MSRVHVNDWTEAQREIAQAVSRALQVPVAELLADGRGPAPTAEARLVFYGLLHDELGMSAAQVGRLTGRTRAAVSKGLQRLRCPHDDEHWVEHPDGSARCPLCGEDSLAMRAADIMEAIYEARH